MAPEGAAGQGGRERHQLKGQCLERKQEGQSRQELKDEGSEDRGGGCELPETKWSVKQELFVTHKLFTREAAVFSTGQEYASATRGIN